MLAPSSCSCGGDYVYRSDRLECARCGRPQTYVAPTPPHPGESAADAAYRAALERWHRYETERAELVASKHQVNSELTRVQTLAENLRTKLHQTEAAIRKLDLGKGALHGEVIACKKAAEAHAAKIAGQIVRQKRDLEEAAKLAATKPAPAPAPTPTPAPEVAAPTVEAAKSETAAETAGEPAAATTTEPEASPQAGEEKAESPGPHERRRRR